MKEDIDENFYVKEIISGFIEYKSDLYIWQPETSFLKVDKFLEFI
jgi:hypothetical protein